MLQVPFNCNGEKLQLTMTGLMFPFSDAIMLCCVCGYIYHAWVER